MGFASGRTRNEYTCWICKMSLRCVAESATHVAHWSHRHAACSAETSTKRARAGKKGYYVEPWLTNETIEALTAGLRAEEAPPPGTALARNATPPARALAPPPHTAGRSSNRRLRSTGTARSTRTPHHRIARRVGESITAPAEAVTARPQNTRAIRTRAPAPHMRTSTASAAAPARIATTRGGALRAGAGSSRIWRRSSR